MGVVEHSDDLLVSMFFMFDVAIRYCTVNSHASTSNGATCAFLNDAFLIDTAESRCIYYITFLANTL